jgi:hypothetical protein
LAGQEAGASHSGTNDHPSIAVGFPNPPAPAAHELEDDAARRSGGSAGPAEKGPENNLGTGAKAVAVTSSRKNLVQRSQKTAIGLAPGLLSLSQARPSSQALAQSSPRYGHSLHLVNCVVTGMSSASHVGLQQVHDD